MDGIVIDVDCGLQEAKLDIQFIHKLSRFASVE